MEGLHSFTDLFVKRKATIEDDGQLVLKDVYELKREWKKYEPIKEAILTDIKNRQLKLCDVEINTAILDRVIDPKQDNYMPEFQSDIYLGTQNWPHGPWICSTCMRLVQSQGATGVYCILPKKFGVFNLLELTGGKGHIRYFAFDVCDVITFDVVVSVLNYLREYCGKQYAYGFQPFSRSAHTSFWCSIGVNDETHGVIVPFNGDEVNRPGLWERIVLKAKCIEWNFGIDFKMNAIYHTTGYPGYNVDCSHFNCVFPYRSEIQTTTMQLSMSDFSSDEESERSI
jgi:hypothetical protein